MYVCMFITVYEMFYLLSILKETALKLCPFRRVRCGSGNPLFYGKSLNFSTFSTDGYNIVAGKFFCTWFQLNWFLLAFPPIGKCKYYIVLMLGERKINKNRNKNKKN